MIETLKQKYVESIRSEYQPKSEQQTKLEVLQNLDKKVRRPAKIFAYTFGIIGALVLGVGMCLAMKVVMDMMVTGIVVGVVGIIMVSINYFLYRAILKSRKAKYAEQIVQLSDELLNK